MQETPSRLLTEAECAERLHVRPRTLKVWRTDRIGPPHIKLGRLVRYSLADLNAWLGTNVRLPLNAQQADERRRFRNARKRAAYAKAVEANKSAQPSSP